MVKNGYVWGVCVFCQEYVTWSIRHKNKGGSWKATGDENSRWSGGNWLSEFDHFPEFFAYEIVV